MPVSITVVHVDAVAANGVSCVVCRNWCCPGVSVFLVAVDYQLSVVSALHFENEAQHQKAVPTAIRQSLSLAGTVEVWHRGWTMRLPRMNRENEPPL